MNDDKWMFCELHGVQDGFSYEDGCPDCEKNHKDKLKAEGYVAELLKASIPTPYLDYDQMYVSYKMYDRLMKLEQYFKNYHRFEDE